MVQYFLRNKCGSRGKAAVVCKRGSFQIFDLQAVVLLNLSYFSRVNKDEWNLDENYDNLDTRWSLIIFRATIDSKLSKDPCNLAELTTLGNTCIIQAWDPHQFLIHFSMEIGQIFHKKCILKMFWTHLALYPLYHGNWPWWNNMMICKASSKENRTDQYPVWMTRKLRKGDFMEGGLEIRTGGGGVRGW